jgi:hypothetical protein
MTDTINNRTATTTISVFALTPHLLLDCSQIPPGLRARAGLVEKGLEEKVWKSASAWSMEPARPGPALIWRLVGWSICEKPVRSIRIFTDNQHQQAEALVPYGKEYRSANFREFHTTRHLGE